VLKDEILAIDDLPTEPVDTPEWAPAAPKVWVRGLTASERDAFEQDMLEETHVGKKTRVTTKRRVENIRAALVVRSVVDEKGVRVFEDKDTARLGRKSALVVNRLWEKARELSGMTEEDVEELAEGFDEAQDDDASSA